MPSTISAGTTAGTAIAIAGDTTGNLAFQTNGTTTAMTIDTSQNVTLGGPTANLYVNATTATNNSNIWIRSGGTDTLGFEAQAPISAGGGGGGFISLRNPSGTLNFRTTTSGGSLNTQATLDGNGLFAFNSGYGSVATAYGCRAWVRFNGNPASPTINASGNISSVTKLKAGAYTVNFTNSMPDVNYSVAGTTSYQGNLGGTGSTYISIGDIRTSAVEVGTLDAPANAYFDTPTVMISVFR